MKQRLSEISAWWRKHSRGILPVLISHSLSDAGPDIEGLVEGWKWRRKHVTINRAILTALVAYLAYYALLHFKELLEKLSNPGIAILVAVGAIVLIYVFREVIHDALVIDPFSVPKSWSEAGITPELIAHRIRDALREIEDNARTQMKKDKLLLRHDDATLPDVEIPGTRIGLKILVAMIRTLLDIHPKHVCGEITAKDLDSPGTVTFYVTQGRDRRPGVTLAHSADIGELAKQTAEQALKQVNPYVFGCYLWGQRRFEQAIEIAREITEDSSQTRSYNSAGFNLWGTALYALNDYKGAIAKYERATELDPKNALAYNNWGNAIYALNDYKGAIVKYEEATELDRKYAFAYNNWGNALFSSEEYEDAIAKYEKATELDPKHALAYNNWGSALSRLEHYEEAIARYERATELDPKYANAYRNWGLALQWLGRHAEAQEKFAKARELRAGGEGSSS